MSNLFDYDFLAAKCSKYETNHLHMYIDDDIDMENLDNMSLSAYATFVHEYVHFIQHITCLYDIRMSDMYNRVFVKYRNFIRTNKTIKIPLKLWETDDEIRLFLTRFNNIEGDKDTAFNISDIEIDEHEVEVAKKEKTAVWIGCYDFDNDKADEHGFRFGHRCIIEGMAHVIQSVINEDVVHEAIPYRAVELIIGKTLPKKVGDKKLIVSICMCALLWNNPSVGFFEVLKLLKQHPDWDGKKMYQSVVRDYAVSHKGQSMPYYRLLTKFSNDLIGSFEALMGTDLEYYSQVINRSIKDSSKCHHQLIDVLYDCDISDREIFKEKLLNHYGYPFIDGKNQSVLPMKVVDGKQFAYKESAILYGIELIMERLLFRDKKKECKRFPICSSTIYKVGARCDASVECLSKPWKKIGKCIFIEAMRYFEIIDKDYQDIY